MWSRLTTLFFYQCYCVIVFCYNSSTYKNIKISLKYWLLLYLFKKYSFKFVILFYLCIYRYRSTKNVILKSCFYFAQTIFTIKYIFIYFNYLFYCVFSWSILNSNIFDLKYWCFIKFYILTMMLILFDKYIYMFCLWYILYLYRK